MYDTIYIINIYNSCYQFLDISDKPHWRPNVGPPPQGWKHCDQEFPEEEKSFYSYINNNDDDVCKVRKNETFLAKRKIV